MNTGFYVIASGMLTRSRELDVIGNNLVNSRTPGYRADRLLTSSFQQELLTRTEGRSHAVLGSGDTAAVVGEVASQFQEGLIQQTGATFDLALSGPGFFNIQSADGAVHLTRNGQFTRDAQGYLALAGAGRVLGTAGPIFLPSDDFAADPSGNLYTAAGQLLGTLRVTAPGAQEQILKEDSGLFRLAGGGAGTAAAGYTVNQGSLETSNVDLTRELTDYIAAQRAFESCSSAMQIVDAMDKKGASQIASV